MQLLTIILALGFLQIWGAENPFHKDAWFRAWVDRLDKPAPFQRVPFLRGVCAAGSVVLVLAVVMYWFLNPETWLVGLHLPLAVVILLYSFGRGEFSEVVAEYTSACYVEDWQSSLERARLLGVKVEELKQGDWTSLHEKVLEEASYRGFERMFAVLFWFVFFGPLGALFYRLLFLYVYQRPDDSSARQLLWALEWLPVRVLGLSFSFTGNFVGCWSRWRETLLCRFSSSRAVLSRVVLGALSVSDEQTLTCDITRKELNMISRLYTRTLWFWLAVIAIFSLLN